MNSDINYIIQQSLNGDKNYQEILLYKLNPLIYKNIYKYWYISDPIVEDLVQEGYIVILISFKNFDKNRKVHYLQYIKTKLFFYYKNYHRNTKNQKNEISLSEKFREKNNLELKDTIEDKYNLLEEIISKEENTELMSYIKNLPNIEQKILYLFYYKEMSINEISNILEIKYRTTVRKKQNSIKKLSVLMNKNRR